MIQIESVAAVEQVEAIAGQPGVDVLFVGPRDLTHALGVPGRIDAPEYRAALHRVLAAAQGAGVTAGVLAARREAAEDSVAEGFGFVGVGSDSSFVAAAARAAAARLITAN